MGIQLTAAGAALGGSGGPFVRRHILETTLVLRPTLKPSRLETSHRQRERNDPHEKCP